MSYTEEAAQLASEIDDPSNAPLRKTLEATVRRAELRRACRMIDHALFGGVARQAVGRVARARKPQRFFVNTVPPEG